jgi:signal transduction histidine kinase
VAKVAQSVRARLTITHLLVALASVALAAALTTYLFSAYYVTQRRADLTTAAESLARAAAPLLETHDDHHVGELSATVSEILGGHACVFSEERLRLAARSRPDRPTPQESALSGCLSMGLDTTNTQITRVNCQGLVYSITVPVRRKPEAPLLGVVVVNCPIAGMRRIASAQRLSSLLAALGAVLLAVLLATFASRAVSRPLQDISLAAERLAEGDFGVHVLPRGPTEIATLARTTNWSARSLKTAFAELSAEREKLSDVLRSMSDGVLAYDAQGAVMLANERARALLRLPLGDLAGRPLAELIEDPDAVAALATGTGPEGMARNPYTLRIETAQLADGGGTVAIIVDISQSARLENMRRDFVANASHQLRAPLTSIRGFLEALSDGTAATPERQARCVAVSLEQVGLLQRLVDQLLELSRLQAGKGVEQRQRLPLVEVAARACTHLEPQAASRQVQLVVDDGSDAAPVDVDVDRLLQTVHNMLDNAIRHSPVGGTVRVEARRIGGEVELAVIDQGPGLSGDEAEAVWERFHSGQKSGGSAGLGLAIAREIVLAHGGRVFSRPNPEGGAVFGFALPAASPDAGRVGDF